MGDDFRSQAKRALARAEAQLSEGLDEQLRYAALELRICIEAITYDRVQGYAELMSPDSIKNWKPQKLMDALIELEPLTNEGPTVHFLDETLAEPDWVPLGKETVFTLQAIKKHYHALGSFVHYPSLEQAARGTDYQKMNRRCTEITALLKEVLASSVFNPVIINTVQVPCDKCGGTALKHMPHNVSEAIAKCFACNAEYLIWINDNGDYNSHRVGKNVPCPLEGCDGSMPIPKEDLKDGGEAVCSLCTSKFVLQSTLRLVRRE